MIEYAKELKRAERSWGAIVSQGVVKSGTIPQNLALNSAVTVASGCALPVAKLAGVLFGDMTQRYIATLTPCQFVTSNVHPSIVYIFSAKGQHQHVLRCYEEAQRRGSHVVIVTCSTKSMLLDLASRHLDRTAIVVTERVVENGGFIPVESTLVLACLIPSLPFSELQQLTAPHATLFETARADHELFAETLGTLSPGTHYHVLASTWALPAAFDFETRMLESGLGATVTDPWNFVHGRYMPFGKSFRQHVSIIMHVSGEEAAFTGIRKRHAELSLKSIPAPMSGFMGALYCLIRSMHLVSSIAEMLNIDPALPTIPDWGNKLYLDEE